MGKADFLTPKAIANRIKAKGLQKLRWYCQLCQKQCRDANGFKCHIESESHQRQMKIFSENPTSMITNYSDKFESDFMALIRVRYRSKRIRATVVYNEFIADRHHVHMNSTKWETLTEFVKYLGRSGQCEVDETPKGWYIKYIDRTPEMIAKMEAKNRRERAEMDEAERNEHMIEMQIKLAKEFEEAKKKEKSGDKGDGKGDTDDDDEEGNDEEGGEDEGDEEDGGDEDNDSDVGLREQEKIIFNLMAQARLQISRDEANEANMDPETREKVEKMKQKVASVFSEPEVPVPSSTSKSVSKVSTVPESSKAATEAATGPKRKPSQFEKFIEEEQKKQKRSTHHQRVWVMPGIVVKIVNQKLGSGSYFKKKAVVKEVDGNGIALIQLLEEKTKIKISQDDLETVIPQIGNPVKIVKGPLQGTTARLQKLNIESETVDVRVDDGPKQKTVQNIPYDAICKCA